MTRRHLRSVAKQMLVVNQTNEAVMVDIRTMTERDIPDVAKLEAEVFTDPWSEKVYRETFALPGVEYVVACADNSIVGAAGVRNIVGTGEITNVMVKTGYRDRGIGRQMIEELLERGGKLGANDFTLEVRVGNNPAIKLYESLGFVCEGVRPGFYNNPKEDAAIYWLH